MRLISKSDFAKERGVSAGRVSQWLHDGRIAEVEGKIDADRAHAALDAALDRTKGMRRDGNVTSSSDATPADGATPIAAPAAQTSAPEPTARAARSVTSALPLDDAADTPGANGSDAAAAAPKDGSKDTSGYWEHKSKREKYDAELAEMKFLQAAGALVPAAGVRREAMESARAVRNAMLAIPDRVAAVLDPGNPARAHKLLTEEIQKVLREQTDRLEQRAAGGVGDAGSVASAAGERAGALQ